MNELIKIENREIGKETIQTTSARELHEFLEVTERFSSWMERQFKHGFEENVDYLGCKVFNTKANQELQDYYLSLDCAKEIAMLQKSDKGREARKYFIECEKQLKSSMPTDPLLMIAHMAQQAYEAKLLTQQVAHRQDSMEQTLKEVQAKQEALTDSSNFFSVLAFANLHDIGLTNGKLSALSRKAGKLSEKLGAEVGTISDQRFGKIKVYHKDVLTQLFTNEQLM